MSDHTIMIIWVIETFFFLNDSVHYNLLFLIPPVTVRCYIYLSFNMPIFAWNVPLVSLIFLKKFQVITNLLSSSISFYCSLKKTFLSVLAIPWNSAFRWAYLFLSPLLSLLLFSNLPVRPPQANFWPCWISFSLGRFWSPPPVQCYEAPFTVLQALCP